MRPNRLQNALATLGEAMREVNAAIEEMRREHDPLASHIFISRRIYRNVHDTKSGKRSDTGARLSWQQACDLGFRSDLDESYYRTRTPSSALASPEPEAISTLPFRIKVAVC